MKTLASAAALAICHLSFSMAAACEGNKILFEDQFQDNRGAWDLVPEQTQLGNGTLRLMPDVLADLIVPVVGLRLRDADICADVTLGGDDPVAASSGILFWFSSWDDFFIFQIGGDFYSIRHYLDKKWISVLLDKSTAIKKDPGATNKLRVTIKGNLLTLYVNGQRLRQIRAQSPRAEWQLGVSASGPILGQLTAVFRDVKVTNVP